LRGHLRVDNGTTRCVVAWPVGGAVACERERKSPERHHAGRIGGARRCRPPHQPARLTSSGAAAPARYLYAPHHRVAHEADSLSRGQFRCLKLCKHHQSHFVTRRPRFFVVHSGLCVCVRVSSWSSNGPRGSAPPVLTVRTREWHARTCRRRLLAACLPPACYAPKSRTIRSRRTEIRLAKFNGHGPWRRVVGPLSTPLSLSIAAEASSARPSAAYKALTPRQSRSLSPGQPRQSSVQIVPTTH
jgi:hypothetical protein